MSHTPDQPYEIPFRAVDHDEPDYGPDGSDLIAGVGHAKPEEWWGTDTDWRNERRDLLRRDRARRNLGGFGFRKGT